ncbi:MAG: cytochrome c [Chloroflexi bacterium]|nr:cytochrome c [Chloroflexota bacterium]
MNKFRVILLIVALGAMGAASACSRGAYPVDVFPEMHYQPSFRSYEPPRLEPPGEAVPITGKEVAYSFPEAADLSNPVAKTPETLDRGTQIYQLNCAVCHGASGRGNGVVMEPLVQGGGTAPVDFASQRVRSRRDGELYWILTNGLGYMPPFGRLLTPQERWHLVIFIRSVSGE